MHLELAYQHRILRGEVVKRTVATLSGGERLRVALASLLLADPPHQLLVFDEPTNNLDLPSIDALVDALSGYRGGLLVSATTSTFSEGSESMPRSSCARTDCIVDELRARAGIPCQAP